MIITGRPEQIEQLYEQEIRPILPVEEEFPVSQEFHRGLIINLSNDRRGRRTQLAPPRGAQPNDDSGEQSETLSKALELKQKYNVSELYYPNSTLCLVSFALISTNLHVFTAIRVQ